jgi:adenylate cyclase
VVLSNGNGKALRVVRGAPKTEFQIDHFNVAGDSQLAALAAQIRIRKHPYWGPPIYRAQRQETFLNYCIPIWSGDTYLGFAVIGISTRALSTLGKELSDPPRSVSFMLYGQDRVHAHPLMTEGSLVNQRTNRVLCFGHSEIRSLRTSTAYPLWKKSA